MDTESTRQINAFTSELQEIEDITKEKVARALKRNIINPQGLRSLAEFSTLHPYGRKILLNKPNLEILLAGWKPFIECMPHDHGYSEGLVFVCEGTAKHKIYSFKEELHLENEERISSGNILSAPVGAIHAMGNSEKDKMTTLHIYWPSIDFMNLYDESINRVLKVSGASGAWVPQEKEHLLESRMMCEPLRLVKSKVHDKDHLSLINAALNYIEKHPLFIHPFFEAFANEKLSNEQIQSWAKQRYFSSKNFPRFLGAFISHIEEDAIRTAYIKQAYEEHGELHLDKIHARQLRQLIYALGINNEELQKEQMLSGTEHFVNTYWDISRSKDLYKTMGAFALGTEPVVPLEMKLCLRGLKTIPHLTKDDKVYFSDHAEHDLRHTIELVDVLLPTLKKPEHYEQVLQGMKEIIDARKSLYDGIAEACNI